MKYITLDFYEVKTIVMYGESDKSTPEEKMYFWKENFPNSTFLKFSGDHFFVENIYEKLDDFI